MIKQYPVISFIFVYLVALTPLTLPAATTQERLFAHKTVEDKHGVITPWYDGQNGQFDNRVRIAAETIKRYPWIPKGKAPAVVPEYIFNSTWHITEEGTISAPPLTNWKNGTMGQNAARMLNGLVEYYQYSGDPAATALMTLVADTFLDICLTSKDHPWPEFPISVPIQGKPYGHCDESGWMQLDIASELGVALLRAYRVTGNERWREVVVHWGELLAAHRNPVPGAEPWPRYANPETVYYWKDGAGDKIERWNTERTGNKLDGSLVYILTLFDHLIRLGEHGKGNSFVAAREAGQAYLREVLLPRWTINATWGRNYWDGEKAMHEQTTSDWAMRYLMTHKTEFPNWRNDVRNILSLFLNHTSASEKSLAEVYNGAWAFPEAMECCDSSLAWGPMEFALVLSRYGVEADSEWARELARRMAILSTYEAHQTGVVEDNIFGGSIAAGGWFIATHPSTLAWVLKTMGWQPDILGANRENHIMRSTSVVSDVSYRDGRVAYRTFDAPVGTYEVLRLAFEPEEVTACDEALQADKGYISKALKGGDYIVTVHHPGCTDVLVTGKDPQTEAAAADGSLTYRFRGNQVRLLGKVGPDGGRADVYLDGEKQLTGIDFWNPKPMSDQMVYSKSGLENARHEIRIVPNGSNPLSAGEAVLIEWVQSSRATGASGVGIGGGPTGTQRMVFGYTDRYDYVDEAGHKWRPGTELITRTGYKTDTVARTWWTMKQAVFIRGTPDDVLYQYGVHWPEITVNVTVGPGEYYVRLKLAETQYTSAGERLMGIYINDERVARDVDVFARSGGGNRALDMVYEGIEPRNGIIEVRLEGNKVNGRQVEAILQALEVGPDQ